MEAYTDLGFGSCLDTRQSLPGAIVILAKGAVRWLSRMQAVTAQLRRRRVTLLCERR